MESGLTTTLMGKEGDKEISAEEAAALAGTIPNELLSRIGKRITGRILD